MDQRVVAASPEKLCVGFYKPEDVALEINDIGWRLSTYMELSNRYILPYLPSSSASYSSYDSYFGRITPPIPYLYQYILK